MSMLDLRSKVVHEYEIGNDISVSTCHVERSALVMSSAVETSITISVNMYIVPMK